MTLANEKGPGLDGGDLPTAIVSEHQSSSGSATEKQTGPDEQDADEGGNEEKKSQGSLGDFFVRLSHCLPFTLLI